MPSKQVHPDFSPTLEPSNRPPILRKHTGIMEQNLNITNLPTDHYKVLLAHVDTQIEQTIKQSITLQNRKEIIEKLILAESILFLSINSISSLLGATDTDSSRSTALYFMFGIGAIAGTMSLIIKWIKTRQEKIIENYRTSIKEIVSKYGEDAWFILEKKRLELPSEVLATGFFRGLDDTTNKKKNES
jgi:hypothetical protein